MAGMRPIARLDALDPHPRASVPGRDESRVNPTLSQVLPRKILFCPEKPRPAPKYPGAHRMGQVVVVIVTTS